MSKRSEIKVVLACLKVLFLSLKLPYETWFKKIIILKMFYFFGGGAFRFYNGKKFKAFFMLISILLTEYIYFSFSLIKFISLYSSFI